MHDGFAIALAWPETFCKQSGSWYDPMLFHLGFNKNGYYKVGHAAIVLVDSEGQCSYFDFGRYHAPFAHGRVRSAVNDHELGMKSKASLNEEKTAILNMEEVLHELTGNPNTHGIGTTHANVIRVKFQAVLDYILKLQSEEYTPYGPFIPHGTNCSRFVSSAIQAGSPGFNTVLRLRSAVTLTPTPMSNIRALGKDSHYIMHVEGQEVKASPLNPQTIRT
jgi:hypothetical protein